MPATRTSYHHGSLRETLMDTCLRLIETEGIGAVSLRRVAREAGVSPGSPYHHFADRAALLGALSARGYDTLSAELLAARAAAETPLTRLRALVAAYVNFARQRPGYFRLMFRPELSQSEKHPEEHEASNAAFDTASSLIAQDCVEAGIATPDQARLVTIAFWGLGHGLASLLVDGQLSKEAAAMDSTPDAVVDQVIGLLGNLSLGS